MSASEGLSVNKEAQHAYISQRRLTPNQGSVTHRKAGQYDPTLPRRRRELTVPHKCRSSGRDGTPPETADPVILHPFTQKLQTLDTAPSLLCSLERVDRGQGHPEQGRRQGCRDRLDQHGPGQGRQ